MPHDDPRHLAEAQAILAGGRRPRHQLFVVKMMNFVLDPDGTDVWITASQLRVRFEGGGCGTPYLTENAPHVVADLMTRMNVARITAPVVGCVPQAGLGLPSTTERDPHADMVAWFVPGDDEIVIHTRPLYGELPPFGPIPESGPWALPLPPPPWQPPPPVMVAAHTPCPHCDERPASYRWLNEQTRVCTACARSFQLC